MSDLPPVEELVIGGDIVLTSGTWRAAGVRHPPPKGKKGQHWAIAARDGQGPLIYGPKVGPFLGLLNHNPRKDEILKWLRACQSAALAAAPTA
jgi:hypothetical protein